MRVLEMAGATFGPGYLDGQQKGADTADIVYWRCGLGQVPGGVILLAIATSRRKRTPGIPMV